MDFHSLNIDLCTILDALEDPIHIIDTDGILVFANLAWEKLIGLPRESAVGLYINDAISRGNQGFYFSIEKDEDSRAAQFTHFDQKLFDSIALTALEKRKRVSMFAYSSSKNRFMLTSIPLYKGDRLQYVLTWCRDLTNFSQLCDDLQSAIEKNKLISEELEFYRKMTTSQNMIGKCPQMIALMKTVEYVAGTDATVLITGESGVGKSETAVELVKRGHRLVADDAVEIRHIGTRLVGSAPELIRHYIELRGIGVVDIQQLFGMSAVREDQDINLVVNLEQWNDQVFYDRLGTNEEFTTILDMKIPAITIPIKPGRNLAIIVEVAAMNNRHKRMGYNAAQEFAKQLDAHFEQMMLSSQLDAADDYDEYESLSGEEEE